MKVELLNPNGIVIAVDHWFVPGMSMSVLIHTEKRYVDEVSYGSGENDDGLMEFEFLYYNDEGDKCDIVRLTEEQSFERQWFEHQMFCQEGKRQRWYAFIKDDYILTDAKGASVPAPEANYGGINMETL